jgi:hypothetical protein
VIHHVVLFQFRPAVPEEQMAAIVADARALPAQIPEIRSDRVSFNRKGRAEPYDVAVHSTFADAEALAHYEGHPAHHAVFAPHHAAVTNVVVFDSEETE